MTYKIISAIIRVNLRFDTLPIIKANVLYDIKSPAVYHHQKYPGLLMYFYSESKLVSISSSIGFYSLYLISLSVCRSAGKVAGWEWCGF